MQTCACANARATHVCAGAYQRRAAQAEARLQEFLEKAEAALERSGAPTKAIFVTFSTQAQRAHCQAACPKCQQCGAGWGGARAHIIYASLSLPSGSCMPTPHRSITPSATCQAPPSPPTTTTNPLAAWLGTLLQPAATRFAREHRFWVEAARPPEDYIYENLSCNRASRWARVVRGRATKLRRPCPCQWSSRCCARCLLIPHTVAVARTVARPSCPSPRSACRAPSSLLCSWCARWP